MYFRIGFGGVLMIACMVDLGLHDENLGWLVMCVYLGGDCTDGFIEFVMRCKIRNLIRD